MQTTWAYWEKCTIERGIYRFRFERRSEAIAMLIPNNLPGIVGSARSIITSASLLRRAVRPPTRKSEFAYLADSRDRSCRKGVGIPRCAAFRFFFSPFLFLTGNENTVKRWRGTRVRVHLDGSELNRYYRKNLCDGRRNFTKVKEKVLLQFYFTKIIIKILLEQF